MALTLATPNALADSTNTTNGGRSGKKSADGTGNNQRAATQKGHDNDTGGLQEAIPGAKALVPKKTNKTPAIARVEGELCGPWFAQEDQKLTLTPKN
jgi:hypothetical protein